MSTDSISPKSDVYSFGVVLLELLSGRKANDANQPLGEGHLIKWAKNFLGNKQRFFKIMDPKLEGKYPMERAFAVGRLALQCLNSVPAERPSMAEVLAALELQPLYS